MKTIFINVYYSYVFNNLFIPGGVFEQFVEKRGKETRIVFLTADSMKISFERFVDGKTVLVETIQKSPRMGRLQRAFQFFYAYLIFTGSTKVLATFGARADAPPAGGNRFLAPAKRLIANTFGRSKFIKTKFVPWAYKHIFIDRPYAAIFDKYSPELVFVPNIAFFPDIEIVAECERRGIKTVGMASNWDHLNKYYIPNHADYLLVQNEPMRGEAVKYHEYEADKVFVVGFPQFDLNFNIQKYLIPREEFYKKFDIPLGNKIVLFVSGSAYSLDEPDILEEISKWIEEGKIDDRTTLMVRAYVLLRDKPIEEKKYEKLQGRKNVVFNWLPDTLENKKYYLSMLYYSDVAISIFSTAAIESAIFNKPMLSIGFDGYKVRPWHQSITRLEEMSHFRHILDTNSVITTRSFEQLNREINNYLNNPSKDHEKREELVRKMCYKDDGKSSDRIVDFVYSKLNEQ